MTDQGTARKDRKEQRKQDDDLPRSYRPSCCPY